MYAAEQTALAQKFLDNPACKVIDKAASWRVLFILSAILLWHSVVVNGVQLSRDEFLSLWGNFEIQQK